MSSSIVAVIPMKPLKTSKSRLSGVLESQQREALILNMLRQVLRAAARASLAHVWVVGGDPTIRHLAEEEGACWSADRTLDLNSCLADAFEKAFSRGLVPLYLPGDLPLVDWPDIKELTAASKGGQHAVIAPDIRGEGTNAMLVPTGSPLEPSLGPGSFRRHLEQADQKGIQVAIYHSPGLSFDLDTPDDLAALEEQGSSLLTLPLDVRADSDIL